MKHTQRTIHSTHEDQKRVLNLLELGLHAVVSLLRKAGIQSLAFSKSRNPPSYLFFTLNKEFLSFIKIWVFFSYNILWWFSPPSTFPSSSLLPIPSVYPISICHWKTNRHLKDHKKYNKIKTNWNRKNEQTGGTDPPQRHKNTYRYRDILVCTLRNHIKTENQKS